MCGCLGNSLFRCKLFDAPLSNLTAWVLSIIDVFCQSKCEPLVLGIVVTVQGIWETVEHRPQPFPPRITVCRLKVLEAEEKGFSPRR